MKIPNEIRKYFFGKNGNYFLIPNENWIGYPKTINGMYTCLNIEAANHGYFLLLDSIDGDNFSIYMPTSNFEHKFKNKLEIRNQKLESIL